MAMLNQLDHKKSNRRAERDGDRGDAATASSSASSEKLVGEMDQILDEIDSILEENAAEFVQNYVQKGGQ